MYVPLLPLHRRICCVGGSQGEEARCSLLHRLSNNRVSYLFCSKLNETKVDGGGRETSKTKKSKKYIPHFDGGMVGEIRQNNR